MTSTRRQFLKTTLAAAAACTAGRAWARPQPAKKKIPIGLQLYAVRGEFARDVPGTIKAVAGLGYQGVEFWGYAGTPNVYKDYSAKQLRSMLDEADLKCCGMHLRVEALEDAQLETTVENNKVLGNRFLIVAAARKQMATEESIKQFAAFLNQASKKCASHGMRVGYHAHGFDFARIGDRFAWDILFSHTGPDVVMQLDVGNCLSGGGDAVATLRKFPGRTLTIHLREHGERTLTSEYYREVFRLCEGPCKTEWYVVEMGGQGGDGLDVPRQALATLKSLGM